MCVRRTLPAVIANCRMHSKSDGEEPALFFSHIHGNIKLPPSLDRFKKVASVGRSFVSRSKMFMNLFRGILFFWRVSFTALG